MHCYTYMLHVCVLVHIIYMYIYTYLCIPRTISMYVKLPLFSVMHVKWCYCWQCRIVCTIHTTTRAMYVYTTVFPYTCGVVILLMQDLIWYQQLQRLRSTSPVPTSADSAQRLLPLLRAHSPKICAIMWRNTLTKYSTYNVVLRTVL